MAEFHMPSLGADMASGTLVQWLVEPGDEVERGDVVAVVETQKGAIDVEIFESGTISRLVVPEGAEVPVGTVLAILNGEAVAAPKTPAPPQAPEPERAAPEAAAPSAIIPPEVVPETRPRVSPLARRRAAELGVDLAMLSARRPNGAISVADVEAAAPSPAPAAEPDRRKAIAAAMSRSNREIPHYYLATEIDLGTALEWLTATNASRPVTGRILYAALLVKAVALAVAEVPEMNGRFVEGVFTSEAQVNAGVAIALREGGLVAPSIHDAGSLPVGEVMTRLADLIERARSGRLRSSEIAEPTITITSLGEQGVPAVYGVIYPPQVALMGFGKIVRRPWVVDDAIRVRPVITATLAGDHRVSDGHRGGRFLAAIDRLLQHPEAL